MEYLLSLVPIGILIVGIFGNLINILIFVKKQMRSSSTYKFLLYLSSFDLMVLIIGGTDVLIKSNFSMGLREFSVFSCNIHKFLTYSTTYISTFISIALSINRARIVSRVSLNRGQEEKLSHTDMSNNDETNSCATNRTPILSGKRSYTPDKKTSFESIKRKSSYFVDAIVALIILFVVVLNLHFILLLKSTSVIYIEKNGAMLNFTYEKVFELKQVILIFFFKNITLKGHH